LNASGPAVEARELTRRFGAFTAVDRVSFEVEKGEIFGYLGANGAGKSTTIRMLTGLLSPTSGTGQVAGHDLARDPAGVKASIGYMSQKFSLYLDLPVGENVAFFGGAYGLSGKALSKRAEEVLELAELRGLLAATTGELPGGLRQRLALACAILHRPAVVFLDEPTAGVDPEGRTIVRGIIDGLRDRGVCVVLTTHELAEAERLADRVVIIDHGRVLAEDSPAGLAAGTADGSVRFSTGAGLDTAALVSAVGGGATVVEERPGRYRLRPGPGASVPDVVAALTGWLAAQGLSLGDLRTGQSLEEAYLAITGARQLPEPAAEDEPGGRGRGRRRSRRAPH
jgi:ABC-2 type transport system ATP-binding protein